MATTYLSKTPSSAGNRKTWTWSGWVKRSGFDASNNMVLWSSYEDANNRFSLQISNTDQFQCYALEGGTLTARILSERLLRDVNSWYHFVYILDTTQATATDRQKLYVNGELADIVSASRVDPSQNADLAVNDTQVHTIGTQNTSNYFNGAMAHVNFIDGTSYAASTFGETDSTTGEWKPITSPSVTYGTNGFFLKFENASSFGEDSSGNNNDFTSNGSPTQLVDTPANILATLNPLAVPTSNAPTLTNGNTTSSTNDGALFGGVSTLAVTKGKWYAECKRISQDSGTADDGLRIGFGVTNNTNWNTSPVGSADSGHYYMIGNGTVYNGSTDLGDQAGDSLISDAGIVQIALDLDNNQISWGFNGGWMDGSGGWTNSTPTTFISITDPASTEAGYFFLQTDGSTVRGYTASWNFGNGYFGTTAVTSGNQDDAGYGTFEYDVPTGYYTLNTKNINTYG